MNAGRWFEAAVLALTISTLALAAFVLAPAASRTQIRTTSEGRQNNGVRPMPGQTEPDLYRQPLKNYDIRIDDLNEAQALVEGRRRRWGARQRLRVSGIQQAFTRAALRNAVPEIRVECNAATSAPEIIEARSAGPTFLTRPSNEAHETIVRRFLAENNSLFGLTGPQIDQLKTVADYTNPNGNLSWVELEQQILVNVLFCQDAFAAQVLQRPLQLVGK